MAAATTGRPAGLPAAAGRVALYALTVLSANGANILTGVRLLAIGPILFALMSGDGALAFWIFVAAAVTDVADGFVAKRLSGETSIGAVLDPLADKLLLASLLVALAVLDALPWWMVTLSLARDLLLIVGSMLLRVIDESFKVAPSPLGKLCTLVQLALVGTVLASLQVAPQLAPAKDGLLWASAAIVVVSGLAYLANGWRSLSPNVA